MEIIWPAVRLCKLIIFWCRHPQGKPTNICLFIYIYMHIYINTLGPKPIISISEFAFFL